MNTNQRPNPFGNMNNRNRTPRNHDQGGYRAWKNNEVPGQPPKPKEINMSSFTEFPDLIKPVEKKSVFTGTSLVEKLKESIAAEEEAAILKRLKKGDTPEMIFREGCVSLPLKNYKKGSPILTVPDWVTDTSNPIIVPVKQPKSMEQMKEERKWKRLGINPRFAMLFDDESDEDDEIIPDDISLPNDEEEDYTQETSTFHYQETDVVEKL